jgi:hypothetical protein
VLSNTTLGSTVTASSLTTLGTIATGVWNGTAIGTQYGGTGQNFSATAQGSIPYFNGAGTMAALAVGSANQCLTTGGAGANPSWQTCAVGASAGVNYWTQNGATGVLNPANNTVDFLIGGTASNSAKFAVLNVAGGTPTASVSAGAAGGISMTATGTLATTAKQTLTLGSTTTGDIAIGTDATSRSLTLGNTTGTSPMFLNAGTAGFTFNATTVSGTTTGSAFAFTGNALTTGTGMYVGTTNTGFTSGNLFQVASTANISNFSGAFANIDWSPGTAQVGTGDLLSINAGANATVGNLFNVKNGGSSVFSVSQSQIISALPHAFTAAGDVSIANDLTFTNQTSSNITSNSPLTIAAGESWESNDLTLRTYNSGNIVFDVGGTAQGVMTGGGDFGFGTTSPLYRLHVSDSQSATYSAMIENTDTGTSSRVLALKHGATTPGVNSRWIDFMGGNGFIRGHIAGNGSNFAALTSGGGDYAEMFAKANESEELPDGTLICASTSGGVTACNENTQASIIGVVSSNYNVLGNAPEFNQPNHIIVGLVGQVATKVTGTIHRGDILSASSITGVATKATKAGFIVGKAQEDYTGTTVGTMMVTVQPGWYDPDVFITASGNVNIFPDPANPAKYAMTKDDGSAVSRDALFNNAAIANLKAGQVEAKKITLNGTDLMDLLNQGPTATGSAETDSKITDLQGQVASLSARLGAVETMASQTASDAAFLKSIMNNPGGNGTDSADLMADLEHLDVNTATVSGTLSVLGKTLLANVGITGDINAGILSIHGLEGQVNTLGGPLQLQSYAIENIEMENGKVIVDTAGNITTQAAVKAVKYNVDTTVASNASAGEGTIAAGTLQLTIPTSAVTNKSLIYVTFSDDYSPATRYWIDTKTTGTSFTIKLDKTVTANTKFNWWIVN